MKMGRSALGGMGIALAAILFVAVNSLAGPLLQGLRLDLTADKLFTLSQGTRAILSRIDEPVTLRFYYSERLGREIPSYGVYAVRVREMLGNTATPRAASCACRSSIRRPSRTRRIAPSPSAFRPCR